MFTDWGEGILTHGQVARSASLDRRSQKANEETISSAPESDLYEFFGGGLSKKCGPLGEWDPATEPPFFSEVLLFMCWA